MQCKLTIGAVDDPLEAEADAMADRVMRMPEHDFIQRKCAHCEAEEKIRKKPPASFIQKKCAHCEEEEKISRKPLVSFIQRKTASSAGTANNAVSANIASTKGGGSGLSGDTKTFMESRFGTNFSGVRIHTGGDAAALSKELNAQAFTVGNNIYFNEGKYRPESSEGKQLLAHELTHTLQQGAGAQPQLQRKVDNVEINCADNQIRFQHDGTITSYALDHCKITDGTYNATVKLSPAKVDFDLGTVPPGTQFDFSYSIAPGQPSPNTFFKGQNSVNITCTNTSGLGGVNDIRFSAKKLTDADFLALTGNTADTIPEGIMIPLSNFLGRSLPAAGPAAAGASYFSPTPWSVIPKNVTGVLWTQGHTSVFANPEGAFAPTIKGYRGNLGYYAGESLPWIGRQCTIQLHEGVPGSFTNDAWFPLFPGEKNFVFVPRSAEQSFDFAERLNETQYGGDYTYSPPRSVGDPILGDVKPTEAGLNTELLARGKAPMCTNNCITVPQAEIEAAMGGRPVTKTGVDVMTGTGPDGVIDPHYAGRGRLMTDAMAEGPLPAGATRINLTVTPGASAGMFIIRGGGYIMLVYGIYQTGSRIANTDAKDLPVVLSEETGSWTGGILGSALGGAAAGAVFCSPTGPIDAVCVVGGFVGGLLFGIAGSSVGKAIGHTVGEYVVDPVVNTVNDYVVQPVEQKAAEVQSNWTREIYNLYGVPLY
ncbi:flagellar motor protein MotB [Niabella soli DSM 19437]|uniref:Flagellar motor protein MotB n=1 Tax=Niabella soli DSM 19437 TaxID=929713 RepID=W0F111_9BACT|nr:flagellar motor protein MotB [Niabella soli DSM 19437]